MQVLSPPSAGFGFLLRLRFGCGAFCKIACELKLASANNVLDEGTSDVGRQLDGRPSGKRTSKLPHIGTASCLISRIAIPPAVIEVLQENTAFTGNASSLPANQISQVRVKTRQFDCEAIPVWKTGHSTCLLAGWKKPSLYLSSSPSLCLWRFTP